MNTTFDTVTLDCDNCAGLGEVAVEGTFGGTVSPEALRTVPCDTCNHTGEQHVTRQEAIRRASNLYNAATSARQAEREANAKADEALETLWVFLAETGVTWNEVHA